MTNAHGQLGCLGVTRRERRLGLLHHKATTMMLIAWHIQQAETAGGSGGWGPSRLVGDDASSRNAAPGLLRPPQLQFRYEPSQQADCMLCAPCFLRACTAWPMRCTSLLACRVFVEM